MSTFQQQSARQSLSTCSCWMHINPWNEALSRPLGCPGIKLETYVSGLHKSSRWEDVETKMPPSPHFWGWCSWNESELVGGAWCLIGLWSRRTLLGSFLEMENTWQNTYWGMFIIQCTAPLLVHCALGTLAGLLPNSLTRDGQVGHQPWVLTWEWKGHQNWRPFGESAPEWWQQVGVGILLHLPRCSCCFSHCQISCWLSLMAVGISSA